MSDPHPSPKNFIRIFFSLGVTSTYILCKNIFIAIIGGLVGAVIAVLWSPWIYYHEAPSTAQKAWGTLMGFLLLTAVILGITFYEVEEFTNKNTDERIKKWQQQSEDWVVKNERAKAIFALIQQGEQSIKEKKFEHAKKVFRKLISSYPQEEYGYYGLGKVQLVQNKFSLAVKAFISAADILQTRIKEYDNKFAFSPLLRKSLSAEQHVKMNEIQYFLACAYSMRSTIDIQNDDLEAAVQALGKAFAYDFNDSNRLKNDVYLQSLREEKLVEKARKLGQVEKQARDLAWQQQQEKYRQQSKQRKERLFRAKMHIFTPVAFLLVCIIIATVYPFVRQRFIPRQQRYDDAIFQPSVIYLEEDNQHLHIIQSYFNFDNGRVQYTIGAILFLGFAAFLLWLGWNIGKGTEYINIFFYFLGLFMGSLGIYILSRIYIAVAPVSEREVKLADDHWHISTKLRGRADAFVERIACDDIVSISLVKVPASSMSTLHFLASVYLLERHFLSMFISLASLFGFPGTFLETIITATEDESNFYDNWVAVVSYKKRHIYISGVDVKKEVQAIADMACKRFPEIPYDKSIFKWI